MHAVEVREWHEPALLALRDELVHSGRGAAVRGERLAGLSVAHEVECPEHAEAARLADDRMLLLKRLQARTEDVLADGGRVLDDAFLLHRGD